MFKVQKYANKFQTLEIKMTETDYLLILSKGNLFPLREKFKEMEGFYNGLSYIFPARNEKILQELINPLPHTKIHKLPLGSNQSFKDLRNSYKTSFYQEKLLIVEERIFLIKDKKNTDQFLYSEELQFLIEERNKLQDAIEWAKNLEELTKKSKKSNLKFQFVCEKEINYILDPAPEIPKLINYIDKNGKEKPFIRRGITAMLVSPGGVGKTHILMQLGLSIATGCKWLNIYPIESKGPVFIGLGENSEEDIHRLVRKVAVNMRSSISEEMDFLVEAGKQLLIYSFSGIDATFIHKGHPTAFYYNFLEALKDKEPLEGWACIILDPISRFLGASAEIDNASATQVIALLENIILELKGNPTIIFGHHMNKSGLVSVGTDQTAARGSSAITDGIRWQANLERIKKKDAKNEEEQYELNEVLLRPVKSNFTEVLPPQKLQKDNSGCFYAAPEKNSHLSSQIIIKRTQTKDRN
jgi:hypothetical protein